MSDGWALCARAHACACVPVCTCAGRGAPAQAVVRLPASPAGRSLAASAAVFAGSVSVLSLFQTSFSRGFTKNMKLEAVNPRNPGELCVASVVSVKGRLMWLHLEGTLASSRPGELRVHQEVAGCTWYLSEVPPAAFLPFKQILNYSVFLNK